MSQPEENECRMLEDARQTSAERVTAYIQSLDPGLAAREDRIAADTAAENASLKSKLHKVIRLMDELASAASSYVACRSGCSACCKMNVSITVLEAERLAVASGKKLARVQQPVTHEPGRFAGVPCPFLKDDKCSVYADRPFACRAHFSFAADDYACQPQQAYAGGMGMVRFDGARKAYLDIARKTALRGFADIRDFFPENLPSFRARSSAP